MTEPWSGSAESGAVSADGARTVGRLLVVCTGNVCRSPYIERRLRQLLSDTDVVIESAGTRALVGSSMEDGSVVALDSVGADSTAFVSRQLTRAMLDEVDLIITATQQHRSDVVLLNPKALRRTFSLGELADLLQSADLRADAEGTWASVVAAAARDQRGLARARSAAESDISDPYGRGQAAYATARLAFAVAEAVRSVHALRVSNGHGRPELR